MLGSCWGKQRAQLRSGQYRSRMNEIRPRDCAEDPRSADRLLTRLAELESSSTSPQRRIPLLEEIERIVAARREVRAQRRSA